MSMELTPDGYVFSCPGSDLVGRGPTESDAWRDFWAAAQARWTPPSTNELPAAPGNQPPPLPLTWRKIQTIRAQDLFG